MTWQPPPPPHPGWFVTAPGTESYWDGGQWTHYRPATSPPRVSHRAAGWVLLGAAVLMLVGSVMPWATALGGLVSASGTAGGDGVITLVFSLVLAGLGLAIGLKQGRLWAPIVALVAALLALAVAGYDIHNVSSKPLLAVGAGLWLTAVAAVAACFAAVVGICTQA